MDGGGVTSRTVDEVLLPGVWLGSYFQEYEWRVISRTVDGGLLHGVWMQGHFQDFG